MRSKQEESRCRPLPIDAVADVNMQLGSWPAGIGVCGTTGPGRPLLCAHSVTQPGTAEAATRHSHLQCRCGMFSMPCNCTNLKLFLSKAV